LAAAANAATPPGGTALLDRMNQVVWPRRPSASRNSSTQSAGRRVRSKYVPAWSPDAVSPASHCTLESLKAGDAAGKPQPAGGSLPSVSISVHEMRLRGARAAPRAAGAGAREGWGWARALRARGIAPRALFLRSNTLQSGALFILLRAGLPASHPRGARRTECRFRQSAFLGGPATATQEGEQRWGGEMRCM